MLLRRITTHVKDQNWFAVFLDFLIVVFGVFIGLQANSWKDVRGDRAEERLLLSRLANEFALIDTRLTGQVDHYHENMVVANQVIEFAAGERDMGFEDLKISIRKITTRRLPPRRSATFTAMMSSGKIDLITDNKLLTELIVYDNQADLLAEVFAFNSDVVKENETQIFRTVRFETNPELASNEFIGPIRSIDIDAFLADPRNLTALQAIYGVHENMNALLERQRDSVKEIRQLLGG